MKEGGGRTGGRGNVGALGIESSRQYPSVYVCRAMSATAISDAGSNPTFLALHLNYSKTRVANRQI